MTTIVDPAGSPTVILRDPSVTVATVTAAGSNGSTATQLTRYSNVNVVAIEASATDQGVKLPAGEEGDYFELYSATVNPGGPPNTYNLKLYDSSGTVMGDNFKLRILRYAASAWRTITQN